jgi:HSP20 family protein
MSERTDPFRDIEELFDQLTQFGTVTDDAVPVDVKDEGDEFVVVADLPGYDTEDLDIQLADEYKLSISAERTTSEAAGSDEYVRRERHTERVERTVTLPAPVDPDEATASHENGVLTVRLGKATADDGETDIPVN